MKNLLKLRLSRQDFLRKTWQFFAYLGLSGTFLDLSRSFSDRENYDLKEKGRDKKIEANMDKTYLREAMF